MQGTQAILPVQPSPGALQQRVVVKKDHRLAVFINQVQAARNTEYAALHGGNGIPTCGRRPGSARIGSGSLDQAQQGPHASTIENIS